MKRRSEIWRDEHGVPHIEAQDTSSLYWGQGYVHARDRGLQMLLMRILVQGRAAECLDGSDATANVDKFFRRMNWCDDTQPAVAALTPEAKKHLADYCAGVNQAFAEHYPWELKLLGYRPEPWCIENSIAVSRMIGYLTLAQSQAEMERLVVEMVQADVPRDKLDELFPGQLGGLDIELLKSVHLHHRIVPIDVAWGVALPRMMASNNWVISGSKTATGIPILANDPHLEGNRLPNVWYEVVLRIGDRYAIGGSMPGAAGVLVGRNNDVAWGATYAFADGVDSWVERCRDGKFYREPDGWVPFRVRQELIKRKKKPPLEISFYENDHGVLDGDPNQEGNFLCTRWASGRSGGVTLAQILKMWDVQGVEQGMDVLGQFETAWNFVLADRHGNIGYQMSGLLPRRREGIGGLIPLPGWEPVNDWCGFVCHTDLPRCLNPSRGFFVTANNDLNEYGQVQPINLPMGSYRADRIAQLLEQGDTLTLSDMCEMQFDVLSLQAQRYLDILRPLLPNTQQGRILRDWDLRYTAASQGAFLFETFYRALYREVFGAHGLGQAVMDHLRTETGTFVDFYVNFDRVLLSDNSAWFNGQCRDEVYRQVATTALEVEVKTWGETQQYVMRHLLLGNKLPRFLGFDQGPIVMIGGRATIHQGQIYRSGQRTTTFVPSFRLVTDLAEDACYTNMAGGPSDRRFSGWYCSDMQRWLAGKYKDVSAKADQDRHPFK